VVRFRGPPENHMILGKVIPVTRALMYIASPRTSFLGDHDLHPLRVRQIMTTFMEAFTDGLRLYRHGLSFTGACRDFTGSIIGFTDTECSRSLC